MPPRPSAEDRPEARRATRRRSKSCRRSSRSGCARAASWLEDQSLSRGRRQHSYAVTRGESVELASLHVVVRRAIVVEQNDGAADQLRPEVLRRRDFGRRRVHIQGEIRDFVALHLCERARNGAAYYGNVLECAERLLHAFVALLEVGRSPQGDLFFGEALEGDAVERIEK